MEKCPCCGAPASHFRIERYFEHSAYAPVVAAGGGQFVRTGKFEMDRGGWYQTDEALTCGDCGIKLGFYFDEASNTWIPLHQEEE